METIEDLFLRYGEGTFSETFFDLDEVYGWSATIPVDPELRGPDRTVHVECARDRVALQVQQRRPRATDERSHLGVQYS